MYRVYCDNHLLYHSNLENLQIFDPTLELEVNKTGSFSFVIYPNHPYSILIYKMKSIITVWQNDFLLFRGRVLDDDIGFYNQKSVICEGDLAFLLDSIQRPFTFSGTVSEYLQTVLNTHNSQVEPEKQFTLGTVTVSGEISVDATEYINTFETLTKTIIDPLGGFIRTRQENGINYIDYLSEFTTLSPQKISFGSNLLDLNRIRKGADIVTAVIPLGAKLKDETGQDTEARLTIASVNDGLDYLVDESAKEEHTTIVQPVFFDEITDPAALKEAGQAYLNEVVNLVESIELTAADLATVDKSVTSFHLGTNVQVTSSPHGINQLFLVSKLSVKLLEPAANKLTLGKTVKTFSEAVKDISSGQSAILQTVEKTVQAASEAVYNVEQNLLASIQTAEQNIQSIVAENYYLKEDTDALVSSVSTEIEQTKSGVEIQFNQFNADIEAVAQNVDAEFESMHKYIRFEDGNIIQGEEGSPFMKVQSSTKESYYDNGAEVAYFSNQMLHVTDGEFLHSLKLGNFAFMPRANGNISFKKVN